MNPWEQYQQPTQEEQGPWASFSSPESAHPADAYAQEQIDPNAQAVEDKTNKYNAEGISAFGKDLLDAGGGNAASRAADTVGGALEFLTTGAAQAIGGVASGLAGGAKSLFGKESFPEGYNKGQQWFNENTPYLNPTTTTGQALTAGLGSLIEKYKEGTQDSRTLKTMVDKLPFLDKDQKLKVEAAVASGLYAVPEILVVLGAKAPIKAVVDKLKPVDKTGNAVVDKLREIQQNKEVAPQEPVPQNISSGEISTKLLDTEHDQLPLFKEEGPYGNVENPPEVVIPKPAQAELDFNKEVNPTTVSGEKVTSVPNYAQMTYKELKDQKEKAIRSNDAMDLAAVKKHFGEDSAQAFSKMSRRQRDQWLENNATEALDKDISTFNGIHEGKIDEYLNAAHDFDTETPQALGRSIVLRARNVKSPDFVGSPDFVSIKNALEYAKQKGWSKDDVLEGMESRAKEWAGSDAAELFDGVFDFNKKTKPALENNASGESAASLEAQSRLAQEKAKGQDMYAISKDGTVRPMPATVDRVDTFPQAGEVFVKRNVGNNEWTVWDHDNSLSQGDINRALDNFSKADLSAPKAQETGVFDISNSQEAKDYLAKELEKQLPAGPQVLKDSIVQNELAKARENAPSNIVNNRTERAVIENIPGLKDQLGIPQDHPVDVVKQAGLNEADATTNRFTYLQSGGIMQAIVRKSDMLRGSVQWFQNAGKRVETAINEKVLPVEKIYSSFKKSEVYEMSEVLKSAMFDGHTFTLEELKSAGLTPKQLNFYVKLRTSFNDVLGAMNKAREANGLPAITSREAYLSSRWQGNFKIPVYDKSGKLVWYIAESTRIGANRALSYLTDKLKLDIDLDRSKIEYRGGSLTEDRLSDAYSTMLDVLGRDDPAVQHIRGLVEDNMASMGFNTLGQAKHFEPKSNIRGFIGDRPWIDKAADAHQMFKEQFSYLKNGYRWSELQPAVAKVKQLIADPELQKAQPNNLAYLKDYTSNQLGVGASKAIRTLENKVGEYLGVDRAALQTIIGNSNSVWITQKLIASTGYVIQNLTQPLMTMAWHTNLSDLGFKHNPWQTFLKGGMDGTAAVAKLMGVDLPTTEIGKKAVTYMENNHVIDRNIYDEAGLLDKSKAMRTIERTAGFTIAAPEKINRAMSFMGFVHHLDQSGHYSGDLNGLFQKAEELTSAAVGDYRSGESPMLFNKLGLIGSTSQTLQTFRFNYLNQMNYFYKEALAGRPKSLLAFVGTQAALGGVRAVPFVNEIDAAWEFLKKLMPDSLYAKVHGLSIKELIISELPELFAFGGMSKLTGANMSSRYDINSLLDTPAPQIADLAKQGTAVGKAVADPNKTTIAQALYSVAPPVVAGNIETRMDAFKAGKAPSGNTIYQAPGHLDAHTFSTERTPTQETYRKFGLTELSEAKRKELLYHNASVEKELDTRRKNQVNTMWDALVRNNAKDFKSSMDNYIAFGGDPSGLDTILENKALQMKVAPEKLAAMKANTIGKLQKVQRTTELLK